MALHEIPVLPVDYPLFDWADWPESRAALVKDGPTNRFQMACWNAMVAHLANALESAGIQWYTGEDKGGNWGYTVEETKITDGILRSYQFNRMTNNIYSRVPLHTWLWAADESYRGYTGELYFTDPPSRKREYVYPEYFTELVYRLNQMIEIMRGTWPVLDVTMRSINADLLIDPGFRVDQGIPVNHRFTTKTGFLAKPLEVMEGIPIQVRADFTYLLAMDAKIAKAGEVAPSWVESHISTHFDGEVIRAAWVDLKPAEISTVVKSLVECLVMVETGAYHRAQTAAAIRLTQQPSAVTEAMLLLGSWFRMGIAQRPSAPTAAQVAAMSRNTATAAMFLSRVTEARERTHSFRQAEISPAQVQDLQVPRKGKTETLANVDRFQGASVSAEAKTALNIQPGILAKQEMRLSAKQPSGISRELTVIKGRPRPAWAEKKTESSANITPETTPSASVGAAQNSEILLGCTIGTAWEPPIWHNGGLWIRQARTIKILPDGSMDLSGSGDPIAARKNSSTVIVAALDTGWLPPVWVDGGLYIRQVREVKVLEDGSLDLTGAGDEMAVWQGSGTRAAAALDTAWYPPVMINGGLCIQQVYEDPVQNENGELEVW